ncbi:MAG: hypothetical protein ACP5RE_03725 [Candidatus Acidifodinimicrobium sp.]
MPTDIVFYPIPYRDTAGRERVVADAANKAAVEYTNLVNPSYAVRPLFFNDFLAAGASSSVVTSTGIVLSSVTASNTTFNYSGEASITFTTPNNKVFIIYGFADYSANPVARLVQVTIAGTTYNPIYLAPQVLTDEDKVYVLKQPFRPIPPNTQATVTIFGTGAGTELFDVLGFVAETPPSISP